MMLVVENKVGLAALRVLLVVEWPASYLAAEGGPSMNYHDGFYKRIFGFPEMVSRNL